MALISETSETLLAGAETPVVAPALPTVTLWRWSVEKYHEMVRAGSLMRTTRLNFLMDGL